MTEDAAMEIFIRSSTVALLSCVLIPPMEEADWRNHRRSRRSEICSLWKHIRVSWPAIFLTARNHEPIETKKKTTTVSADEDLSSSQVKP
ncbi:hypothetical protein Bca4012_032758 [Brassica carinata]|nr:hypothetical protein F2Q69_00016323 [Brassica cretica]